MGAKRMHVFVTGTMNSHFFVTEQIGMKFLEKNVSRCPLFWVVFTGFCVAGLQVIGYVFTLAKPSVY